MPVQPPALGVGPGLSPQQSGGKRHLSEYPLRDSLNVLDTRSPSSSALLDLSFKDTAWPSRLPTTPGGEECPIPVGNPSPTIESRAANKPCLPRLCFVRGHQLFKKPPPNVVGSAANGVAPHPSLLPSQATLPPSALEPRAECGPGPTTPRHCLGKKRFASAPRLPSDQSHLHPRQ